MASCERWLILAVAAVWSGLFLGGTAPAGSSAAGALLACAAAAFCGGLSSKRGALWWLASLALSSVGVGAAGAARQPASQPRLRGCVVSLERSAAGWTLELLPEGGGETRQIEIPRTGVVELDTFDPRLTIGARLRAVPALRGLQGRYRSRCAALLRVEGRCRLVDHLRGARAAWRASFLRRARRRLLEAGSPPGGASALLYALVTGDRRPIDSETARALRASGLAHLAVVSGLHVGLLLWFVSRGAARLGGSRHVGFALLHALLLIGLLVLLPASPPVLRAGCVLLLVESGVLLGRRGTRLGQLGAVVLLLLLVDPPLARSWSLALTVAATVAILLALRQPKWRRRLLLPLAPFLATWPLVLRMAGRASPWGVPATLLASPALAPAIGAGWLALMLPEGPAMRLALSAARAAAVVIEAIALEAARWPGSGLAVPRPGVTIVALHLALLGGLLLARRERVLLAGLTTLIGLTVFETRPPPPVSGGTAGIFVADVGQGQAVIAAGDRDAVLLDAGPPGRRAVEAVVRGITALGLPRPELLALSHADIDHVGGAPELLQALRPRGLALPGACVPAPRAQPALRAALRLRMPLLNAATGLRLRWPGLALDWLFPPAGRAGCSNRSSSAILVRAGGVSAFVGGDLDQNGELELLGRWQERTRVDVLVAGHHGSRTSTSSALLAALEPRWVVFSCGRRAGHPHPEVVERARSGGAEVWITSRDGGVLFERRGRLLRLRRVR